MELLRDLRYAIRALRRTPSLVAIVVLCLGLGIGANTTVFSWMEEMVLRPVPALRDPERLAFVRGLAAGNIQPVSYPDYVDVRDASRTLSGVAAYFMYRFGLQDPAHPGVAAEPVWGVLASGNYFDVLGIRPVLGRLLRPDDAVARGGAPVAVIGYGLWKRRFGGDPSVVGRQIRLNGLSITIVGVVGPGFSGTYAGLSFDLWVPITMVPLLSDHYATELDKRGDRWLDIVGRLAPDVSMAQAKSEMATIGRRLASTYPDDRDRAMTATVFDAGPGQQFMRPLLVILLGITGLVLLVVCSNVAGLLLARGAARQREFGVRVALGANRSRLVRQLLAEGLLLAVAGGVAGIGIAAWGRGLLAAVMPGSSLPLVIDPPLDPRVLAFSIAVSLVACLAFALLPALRASQLDVLAALKSTPAGSGRLAHSRVRAGLVVAQVAIALTAIVCAGLFVRSLAALRQVDPGFRDADHVLLFPTDLSLAGIGGPAEQRRLTTDVLDRLRALPGVRSAALASFVPLGFEGGSTLQVRVPGYSPGRNESMSAMINEVTSGYFETMGVRLVEGRPIDDHDRADAPAVAVVNQEFVRRYFAGRSAVGQRIFARDRELVIVGVAVNGKYRFDQLDRPSPPFMYVAGAQFGSPALTLHVRTAGDPAPLVARVRRELASAAPSLPVPTPLTLAEYSSAALLPSQLGVYVLSVLGAVALLLSAIGLYGRLSYAVAQRTRDIGIRMAIGATERQVLRVVLRDGAAVTGAGAAFGIVLALIAARVLSAVLPHLPAIDITVLAASTALLALVALVASWLPARRAARIDPLAALKTE